MNNPLSESNRKLLIDLLTLNCISYLESFPECQIVETRAGDAVQSHEFLLWEKRNSPFILPHDMRR